MVKWVGAHHLDVMRSKSNQFPATLYGPNPAYSARQTIIGTAVVAAVLLAAVFALAYPVAVVGIVVSAVVTRRTVRMAGSLRQRRRREGRTRHFCIPMTGVCVEA